MLTREIHIGNLALGGTNPVRIQSMTNTNTMDTLSTVKQVMELVDAGCELVRITARNKTEAENLQKIKDELLLKGCSVPLIADIHFQPEAAEIAARIVNKVRINPGNYVDKRSSASKTKKYTKKKYQQELEKINSRLAPLIAICKEYGTAIRIGVNHGSLSERITERYGDTPEGMVVSAMEFIKLFVDHGFHNLVLSMKSSNVKTMIYSYLLLAAKIIESSYNYPLHLGVTEAGAGIDARIKSVTGIGELLMEGIGDTIRVSLTENPVHEIPVAKQLCQEFVKYRNNRADSFYRGYSFTKVEPLNIDGIGSDYSPAVITTESDINSEKVHLPDYYYDIQQHNIKKFNSTDASDIIRVDASDPDPINLQQDNTAVIAYNISLCSDLRLARKKLFDLKKSGNKQPIVLYKKYNHYNANEIQVAASAEYAFFLIDGMLNGICIDTIHHQTQTTKLMFSILQAMGLRRFKAEFIACPTCGRTSYDVEGTLEKISLKLSHLKNLKIGVMGCIVNGPGEMADADYGYVGSQPNKINLYKGKKLIRKNIDEAIALEELIKLIKENGDWKDE